ncbi:hypothetical protein PROFUN_04559 [Planoprotostelium fungivorum]|uniref:Uncharacterized protein n=1 Tax=Planoprotostelium fungivorum TaxID=1890364 RepID=A0A2P6NBI7_9EUKA|nr:hypothetical protein PROFUN_04559 [Planoprotostelium fungivorum]
MSSTTQRIIIFTALFGLVSAICENTKNCTICEQECSNACEGRYSYNCDQETFKQWNCSCDKIALVIAWLTIALSLCLFFSMGLSFALYLYRRKTTKFDVPPPPADHPDSINKQQDIRSYRTDSQPASVVGVSPKPQRF